VVVHFERAIDRNDCRMFDFAAMKCDEVCEGMSTPTACSLRHHHDRWLILIFVEDFSEAG
jgi:hypothetical protein